MAGGEEVSLDVCGCRGMGLGVLKLKMIWLDVVYDACGSLRIWERLTGGIMVVVGGFWERLVGGFGKQIKLFGFGLDTKERFGAVDFFI